MSFFDKYKPVTPNPLEKLKVYQDGNIFEEPENLNNYLQFYFGSMIVFFIGFHFWWFMVEYVFKPKEYFAKSQRDKMYYVSLWGANNHHVVACIAGFMNYFNSPCEGSYPFVWFYDDVCKLQVDPRFVCSSMITCGYLTYDWFIITFYIKDSGDLAR